MRSRRTIAGLVLMPLLTAAGMLAPTCARADEVPPEQRLGVVRWSEGAPTGDSVGVVSLDLGPSAAPGTTVSSTLSSCGRPIADQFFTGVLTVGPDGKAFTLFELLDANRYSPTTNPDSDQRHLAYLSRRLTPSDLLGPTYDYAITITQPGYDPYVVSGSHALTSVRRPGCAQVDRDFARTIRVTSWSSLVGRPRVGRTVALVRPVAPGAHFSYRWVGRDRRVVGRHRTLRLTRTLRGQFLTGYVKISAPGHDKVTEGFQWRHAVR